MWRFNPNFDNLTFSSPFANLTMPSMDFFKGMEDSEIKPKSPKSKVQSITEDIEELFLQSLRPSGASDQKRAIPLTPAEAKATSNHHGLEFDVPATAARVASAGMAKPDLELDLDDLDFADPVKSPIDDDGFDVIDNGLAKVPVAPETEIEAIKLEDELEPYDPTLDLSRYKFPTTDLLLEYDTQKAEVDRAELEANKDQIIATLLNYKIEITKSELSR